MEEMPTSKLYVLEPLVRKLPEVELPKRHVSFREKFFWTGLALIVFFVLSQVPLYGMVEAVGPGFGRLRYVLASHRGTLMELGIGPIVTAGIILQLLVGSKIINLDLGKPRDRALFTGVQKGLAMFMGVFQGTMLVLGGWYGFLPELGWAAAIFLVIQLAIGTIIVIYLDELVSKYGFGSGISLFIAAGVSGTIIWQAFNPIGDGGAIPFFIRNVGVSLHDAFFRPPLPGELALPSMAGLLATIIVFLIVVYAQNMRVEIPLAYGRFGGIRGRYPIRFLYASVIPVILAMMLFANIQIANAALGGRLQTVVDYTTPPPSLSALADNPVQGAVYLGILVGLCMGFAYLWISMTGMGPRDVARQLDRSGMLIPGFRRDVRVMEKVLGRYIITVTLLGGAFVGALAAVADLTGALGTGTGILLTVGIVYGLYEEIARERVSEMFPAVRRLLGE
jgi:preprotein translocase subunit SecY